MLSSACKLIGVEDIGGVELPNMVECLIPRIIGLRHPGNWKLSGSFSSGTFLIGDPPRNWELLRRDEIEETLEGENEADTAEKDEREGENVGEREESIGEEGEEPGEDGVEESDKLRKRRVGKCFGTSDARRRDCPFKGVWVNTADRVRGRNCGESSWILVDSTHARLGSKGCCRGEYRDT
jgi:hypothetical protein